MRLLAVGDIHGCFKALKALEEFVGFSDDDLVVTLGDYVDRGPNSREVMDWVIARVDRRLCAPLRGNHEIMMLEALSGRMPLLNWLQYGGDTAMDSYTEHPPGRPEDVSVPHLQFLSHELLPWFETPEHIFVHASLDSRLPLAQQHEGNLYWERFDFIAPHISGKQIICGHTSQKSGVPFDKGFAVCIDTWCYGGGWLTCLDVHTGQYWQANEQGQTRSDWLPSALRAAERAGRRIPAARDDLFEDHEDPPHLPRGPQFDRAQPRSRHSAEWLDEE